MKEKIKKINNKLGSLSKVAMLYKLSFLSILLLIGYFLQPFMWVCFVFTAIFMLFETSVNSLVYLLFFISSSSLYVFKNAIGLNFWVLSVCVYVLINGIKILCGLFQKKRKLNVPLAIIMAICAVYLAIPFGREYTIISLLESYVWLCFFYIVFDNFYAINVNACCVVSCSGFVYSSLVGLIKSTIPYLRKNIIVYYSGALERFSGTMINPNVFYCIGIASFALLAILILNKKLKPYWIVLGVPTFLFSYIALSKTFAICCFIFLFAILLACCLKPTKFKWKVFGGLVLTVTIIATVLMPYTKAYYDRFFNTAEIPIETYIDYSKEENNGESTIGGIAGDNVPNEIVISKPSESEIGINTITTGRFALWKEYIRHIISEERLLIGFGINTAYGYLPNNSHNMYIQIFYELGILGYVIILGIIVYYLIKTKFIALKRLDTAWYLSAVVFAVIGMAENLFLSQIGNMMLILACLGLSVLETDGDSVKYQTFKEEVVPLPNVNKIKTIAILTPTYNRATLLPRLYESLVNQTNKNFVWYVVDDGSSDNTKEVIEGLISEEKIKIKYFNKPNGGKHTALNVGIKQICEDLLMIVDSDDYLTTDAVQTVINDAFRIEGEQFCGLGYLKQSTNGNVVGKKYTEDYVEDTFINQRYNKNTYGDKCEVFKTAILKQFPFPEFEGEKFLSEATVWCKMSGPYKMVFINKAIYFCEYQEGGLSDGVKKTLFKNPKGAVEVYKALSTKDFSILAQTKYTILLIVHAKACGLKARQIVNEANNKLLCFLLLPIGIFVYKKRKRSFKL